MKRLSDYVILLTGISFCATTPASAVAIDWLLVGNPRNAADPASGFGAVPHAFNISRYDITVSQYAEFLNAKDPFGVNALGLYHSDMSEPRFGSIRFDAENPVGAKYDVAAGRSDLPANSITWYNAVRFCNWLNNGQGAADTESGAYTLVGGASLPSNGLTVSRNASARVFLPTEDEWYKAAHYDFRTGAYYRYPTSSNDAPKAELPAGGNNSANYGFGSAGNFTPAGAYGATKSPYGAFDMAGNVFQWNESLIGDGLRGLRGGSFYTPELFLNYQYSSFPGDWDGQFGFRVASSAVNGVAGDANYDGAVDCGDVGILKSNLGPIYSNADCDFTGDRTVDEADLAVVRANFGRSSANAVPEPAALAMALAGIGVLLAARRRLEPPIRRAISGASP